MFQRRARRVARGLGWFSIALGVTELAFARPIARSLGTPSTGLIRAFGVREIAAGIGLLTQTRKGPWVWARIVGDILDVGVLGAVAGAALGNAVERGVTKEQAVEILLQLRNGERRAIVQAQGNENWVSGEPVIIVTTGGKARVVRAPAATRTY